MGSDTQNASRPGWPSDVDRESGYRLPMPKREDMDAEGQAVFDATLASANASFRGGSPGAGLKGPAGIQLYSPQYRMRFQSLNDYLRFEAGIPPRLREITILSTARETDHQFEWCAHEQIALREGVEASVIDVIRHRQPVTGLAESDATIIALVREAVGLRKVSSATYARARALYGTRMLVDLTALVGHYLSVGVLLNVFDMQLRDGWTPSLPPR